MTKNNASESFTPAAEPTKEIADRQIIARWVVGETDENGWQPQTKLVVSHWPRTKCYDAQLRVGRIRDERLVTCEMLTYRALTEHVVIVKQGTSRFNRKALDAVYEEALALLRSRFDAGEDAVMAYFDPTSVLHAV